MKGLRDFTASLETEKVDKKASKEKLPEVTIQ